MDILPMLEAEAKERQRLAAEQTNRQLGRSAETVSQIVEQAFSNDPNEGKSTQQAAAILNTNERYVSDAKRIAEEAPFL